MKKNEKWTVVLTLVRYIVTFAIGLLTGDPTIISSAI